MFFAWVDSKRWIHLCTFLLCLPMNYGNFSVNYNPITIDFCSEIMTFQLTELLLSPCCWHNLWKHLVPKRETTRFNDTLKMICASNSVKTHWIGPSCLNWMTWINTSHCLYWNKSCKDFKILLCHWVLEWLFDHKKTH